MTREELARHDGREGRKAYVAVHGKIYDFTGSALWQDGDHQQRHQAGCDLTQALLDAPHVRAVVERYPVVDHLEEETATSSRRFPRTLVMGALVLILVVVYLLTVRS